MPNFSIPLSGLTADSTALSAVANNLANQNTAGYSRLRPILVESDPVTVGSVTYGSGVTLQQIESVRDPILEYRIQEETQQEGQLNAFVSAMQQTQVQFTTSSSDIGTEISNFFSSLTQLSADPTSLPVRQGVLTAAGNLASAFHNVATNLLQQQSSLNQEVGQDVQQVNTLTGQIAQLNTQISAMQGVDQDASALLDQRDTLISQLSGLIDVSQIQSGDGITLTTANGAPLVTGGQSFALSTETTSSGQQDVYSQGSDITAQLTGGNLGGVIQVRDGKIPALLGSLDTLSSGLATGLNAANAKGFDLYGAAGGNLFVPPSGSGQGYAANMAVAITDPSLIAASSDGSPGSNGNLAALSAVENQPIADGQSPTNYYANLVAGVGNDVSSGSAELSSAQLVLNQMQDQLNSVSGVSLDEEASNMVQYQNAYEAAAHVVTTVNDMLYTVIQMGTLTG
jgi:flagellar hook-associated protein 1 FlgK